MALRSDGKFEEKLTLGSKNDMRNLMNFNAISGKSENFHFDIWFFSIAYEVSGKKVKKELSLMTLEKDPNFAEKLSFCLKNDRRIWWSNWK